MSMFFYSCSYGEDTPTIDEVNQEISKNIVGLPEIKLQLKTVIVNKICAAEKYASFGLRVVPPKPFHMVFLGHSGTGKSTVARILGKLFYLAGASPSYDVIEMQGLKSRMKNAKGGILLVNVDQNDYNTEILHEIAYVMDQRETSVIFAGSRKQLNHCMQLNKELYKRFSAMLSFNNFTCEELAMILETKMNDQSENSDMHGFKLHPSCSVEIVGKLIAKETTEKLRKELNGHLVDAMLNEAKNNRVKDLISGDNEMDDDRTTFTLRNLEASLRHVTQIHNKILGM